MGASKTKTWDLAYIALCSGFIAICSWISIPTAVPFTLQTFAVFTTVGILGGKRGTMSVLLYILLGTIGLPVFSGFAGGPGVLLGNTGGYILGFLFTAIVMWAIEAVFGKNSRLLLLSMVIGLMVCYTFGTIWYLLLYTKTGNSIGVWTVLGWCVFPFIIPDLMKIGAACLVIKRIAPYLRQIGNNR